MAALTSAINQFWAEVSDSVAKIEILYEDTEFPDIELVALVASKIYYHLGELDDSLTFALGAGKRFDLSEKSEYVETINCFVERMCQRCAQDEEYEQAIGIALESRRLDVVKAMIEKSDTAKLLSYVLKVSMTLVQELGFRNQVLQLLVDSYQNLVQPDYIPISQCLVHLNDPQSDAHLLKDLIDKGQEFMAYQIVFDLELYATRITISLINWILHTLSTDDNRLDEIKTVNLKSGGHTIEVTKENKKEYVTLINEWWISKRVEDQFKAFKDGFNELDSQEFVNVFDERELDMGDWKKHTDYWGYTKQDDTISMILKIDVILG
ncbi:hypothetical protein BC941DRAFT_467249 [Chlamydoabsidia padenii]|nr:hypothetical protein BC941DRAFT_467249 [Chlamydoabsidia padenii]